MVNRPGKRIPAQQRDVIRCSCGTLVSSNSYTDHAHFCEVARAARASRKQMPGGDEHETET
jgi:hypothetical protein